MQESSVIKRPAPAPSGSLTDIFSAPGNRAINVIADQVYKILEQRLGIEKERRGLI